MSDMRSCIKTGCRWPAAATLSYRYATAEVWLSDLTDPHPSTHDLCPHHADTLTVPRGWQLVDDRRPAEAVREPSAAEIVERVATLRRSVDVMLDQPQPPPSRRSRYEALLGSLPVHQPPAADDGHDDGRDGGDVVGHDDGRAGERPRDADQPVRAPAVLVPVGVAHEMAPIARELVRAPQQDRDDRPGAPTDDGGVGTDASAVDVTDGGVHRTGLRGAVVLSLPLRTPSEEPNGGAE